MGDKNDMLALGPPEPAASPVVSVDDVDGDNKQTATNEDAGGWDEGRGPPADVGYDLDAERMAGLLPSTDEAAQKEKRKRKAQKLIDKNMGSTLNPRKV